MRVLVCGSRDWDDLSAIESELTMLPAGSVVIHGDCRGADRIADEVARRCGYVVERYPADWRRHGKAAGPMRNMQMVVEGRPDLVLAFQRDGSAGTQNMVDTAKTAGIPVVVYREDQEAQRRDAA